MRIVIIASFAESTVNFRGPLIEELLAQGHEVHVAAPSLHDGAPTTQWMHLRGAATHDIPLDRTGLGPRGDMRTAIALFRLFTSVRPDLLLAYTIKPVIWGMLSAWFAGVPHRVSLITGLGYAFMSDGTRKRRVIRSIVRHLYRTALKRATLVFFQNPDDLADLRRWNILPAQIPVKIVNGSGVDTKTFNAAPLPAGPTRFLMIGRLLKDKGVQEFAEAARLARAQGWRAEFHLVGPLDTNPESLGEDEILGWQKAGILTWHGAAADVRPFYSDAHVYVLPSYREGTPRTVLEAMSMGRPIITTDAPGCRETVEPGVNGILVPVRDSRALADAMWQFIENPDLIAKMGAESRRIAETKYDVRKVNSEMLKAMGL